MTKRALRQVMKRALAPGALAGLSAVGLPAWAEGAAGATGGVVSMPEAGQVLLQHPYSPVAQQLVAFHTELLWIIGGIVIFVLALLLTVIVRFNRRANPVPSQNSHNTLLEVAWTVLPVLILVIIAVPSFRVLYYGDKAVDPQMTVKITGHQWYWSYEYPDQDGIGFDSLLVEEGDLKPGQPRLLTVDNQMVVPVGTTIRLLLTGADVIHSWFVPSLGVQLHAVPGRINETWTKVTTEGTFYGQCTLICGTNHAFMPIVIRAVSADAFAKWAAAIKAGGPDAGNAVLAALDAPPAARTATVIAPPAARTAGVITPSASRTAMADTPPVAH